MRQVIYITLCREQEECSKNVMANEWKPRNYENTGKKQMPEDRYESVHEITYF